MAQKSTSSTKNEIFYIFFWHLFEKETKNNSLIPVTCYWQVKKLIIYAYMYKESFCILFLTRRHEKIFAQCSLWIIIEKAHCVRKFSAVWPMQIDQAPLLLLNHRKQKRKLKMTTLQRFAFLSLFMEISGKFTNQPKCPIFRISENHGLHRSCHSTLLYEMSVYSFP